MPSGLRFARAAIAASAAVLAFGAGPVRDVAGQAGADVDLPEVADPETATGDELVASLRAYDEAVVTLAEQLSAAGEAHAAAVADLEEASAAHARVADEAGGNQEGPAGDAPEARPGLPVTDMFHTLNVRPSTTARA